MALWYPGGAVTFEALDAAARALSAKECPQTGRYFLAQGDGVEVATALLAGFLQKVPVQVVEKDRSRRLPAIPVPSGTALIKQTIGSSGARRCQFFSAAQVLADIDRLHAGLGLAACQVSVAALSVAHSFGLTTTVLQTLLSGLPMHWLPTPFPMGMLEAFSLHEGGAIFLPGVPAMWKAWLLAGLDVRRVRLAVSAGSPLTLDLERRVRESMHLKLHNLYGTSECGAISYDAGEAPRTDDADMGTPLPGVTVSQGVDGLLLVKSDAVGIGYDEFLPTEVFGHGELVTCDRVRVDEADGRLLFDACLGAGINVASRKLSPREIANKIRAATGLADVQIHGTRSRDPERVQDVVVTLAMPAADLTPEFKSRACATLANWEVPRQWRVK